MSLVSFLGILVVLGDSSGAEEGAPEGLGWEHCSQLPPAPHSSLGNLEEEALSLEEGCALFQNTALSTRELWGFWIPRNAL